ncbi:hypothetical protein IKP94_00145 [Candidatus Saccharibacteria bacterium]|nr:hypothetical protein [Candidatus Saccharibacteria bacterium]
MVLEERIVEYIQQFDDIREEEQRNKDDKVLRVFYCGERIVLVVEKGTEPLRIELRCDYRLSKTLQEQYESVMESRALGRNGIEIICSGQLSDDEVIDLVRHSYEETKKSE